MAQIIINKNTNAEFRLDVEQINEDIAMHMLSGHKNYILKPDEEVPEIPALLDPNIETIELITTDGSEIPVIGTYNKVTGYNATYYELDNVFAVYISIGYEA